MLVHRDKDDQSGSDQAGKSGKPHLADRSAGDEPSGSGPDLADGVAVPEEGKTHLIGDALKSVYQRTLEEDIPDDFLDLLKQLK